MGGTGEKQHLLTCKRAKIRVATDHSPNLSNLAEQHLREGCSDQPGLEVTIMDMVF